jgi:hypothetical protein
MAGTNQTPASSVDSGDVQSVDNSDVQDVIHGNGADSVAPASYTEAVWVFGETLPPGDSVQEGSMDAQSLSNGDTLLATAVSVDTPTNLDHALDQLTTVTDLFDLPVFDFHGS